MQTRATVVILAVLASPSPLPPPSHAQRFTGELSATVVDETGAVVPNASVTLTNEASGDQRRTVSNSDGFFAFSAVPSGTYTVSVEMPGFKKTEIKVVSLRGGDSRSLRTIKLAVAGMSTAVSVTAEIQLV